MKVLLNIILPSILVSLALANKNIFNIDKKQYYIETESKYNWFQAQSECTQKQMSLLTIDTPEKIITTHKLLIEAFKNATVPRLYIGANDFGDFRKFVWTATGRKMTSDNWLKAEPNNYRNTDERCVHIGHHGSERWNDINCSSKYGFICENVEFSKTQREKISRTMNNFLATI